MIPQFNEYSYLPAGVHVLTLDEIGERFGSESEVRRVQCESLRWLVETAIRAGVRRILLDGSFVTDVIEPNDVDCLLLIDAPFPVDEDAVQELREGLPFLDIELADGKSLDFYVDRLFATDRQNIPKGLIEILV